MAHEPTPTPEDLAFDEGVSIGAGLRAAREALGESIEDVAAATRVRRAHLLAIEEMAMERLPSRPFVIGYIRAYAGALGLDADRASARFRSDVPADDEEMRAPIGSEDHGDPRRAMMIVAGVAVLAAILIWNITQRALFTRDAPKAERVVETADVEPPAPEGPIWLDGPTPPPVEASLPSPYVTPGLENADPELAAEITAAAEAAAAENAPPPEPFVARGEIFGAPANQPHVMLQAVRDVTLIIRPPQGQIREILNLKGGQSYRAPIEPGLLVDVSMASSVEYYVDGVSAGRLPQAVTSVTALSR